MPVKGDYDCQQSAGEAPLMSLDSERMAEKELKSRIMWEPWVDLPEYIMARESAWREWNRRMKLRDEANRLKIDEELSRLQESISS